MAKKVVAAFKSEGGKGFTKVIRMKKKSGKDSYTFTETIVSTEKVQEFLKSNEE
jgi:hypothetical protein